MNTFTRFQISRGEQIKLSARSKSKALNQISVTKAGNPTSAGFQSEHFYWSHWRVLGGAAPHESLSLIWGEAEPKRAVGVSGACEEYRFNVKDCFSGIAKNYIEFITGIAVDLKLAFFALFSFVPNPFKDTKKEARSRTNKRPFRNTPTFNEITHGNERLHRAILPLIERAWEEHQEGEGK